VGGIVCPTSPRDASKRVVNRTGLIICDPPIKRVLTDYSGQRGYNVTTSPYNGGYTDFLPLKDQVKSRAGPPQTSFLDDILFYLRNHSDTVDLSDPSSLRVFVEKISASHYLKLAEYLQATISTIQWNLSRRQDLSVFSLSATEEQWSDIQAWQRRIGEYKDDIQGIMVQLQIPLDNTDLGRMQSWKDSVADYQFLYDRFTEIGQRVNYLNASIATLVSIAGNHHAFRTQELSLHEAKSTKALTILGILFIPFAYVASLLSMSGPYALGGDLFWLYFAISFPLTGLVLLGYYILELGYANGKLRWSLHTLAGNFKERFK